MKIFFRRIHLYLALASGLIIMITCFTGAILVFEQELQHTFHKERYYVVQRETKLSIAALIKSAKEKVPGAEFTAVRVYKDEKRSAELVFTLNHSKSNRGDLSNQGKSTGKPSQRENSRRTIFINPYTGEILDVYNNQESFFYSVMSLHRWLLSGDVGKLIVGISTSIFLFILLTGIILWWPKTRNILRQRVRVNFRAGWKRINHDFHIVFGFYTAIFLFVFAFTGLAWSFEWFNKGIYKVTGSSMQPFKIPVTQVQPDGSIVGFDEIFEVANNEIKNVLYFNISLPKDSTAPYTVNALPENAPHETASDNYYMDRYSGKIIASQKFSERNTGQKVRSTFRPIHVSSIFGLPSKIVGLIVCVIGTSFPITGYIMWINRIRKKKSKTQIPDIKESALI